MRYRHLVVLSALVFTLPACAKRSSSELPPAAVPVAAAPAPEVREPVTAIDIQRALNENGVKVQADGKMGPRTKQAIKKFQAKHGLKRSGIADEDTLKKLGL